MENLIALKKQRNKKFFSLDELSKFNTKNLLAFYKKERARYYSFIGGMTCECCGERMSNLYPNDDYYKNSNKIEKEWELYLKQIKDVLNTREHVENKKYGKTKNNR